MIYFRFIAVRRFVPGVLLLVLLGYVAFARAEANEVNYDTAWTFVYDGALRDDKPSNDVFFDVEELQDGKTVCVGISRDTSYSGQSILLKLDAAGHVEFKKIYNS